MALKTVTGKLTDAAGNAVAYPKVRATLSAPAVIASTQEIAPGTISATGAADGTWSLSAQSNLDLTPNTTSYLWEVGSVWSATVVVPSSPGPFPVESIMAAPPAVSPPAALDSAVVHKALDETLTGVKSGAFRAWGDGVFNVKAAQAGAIGNGVADDTAAVTIASVAAGAALIHPDPFGGTNDPGRAVLEFPPGAYLIADANALLPNPTQHSAKGYVIRGAGRGLTQIKFAPTSAKALITNPTQGWHDLVFEDLTFVGGNTNATFMNTVGPNVNNYIFNRVDWDGTWANGFNLTGGNNNDTFSFFRCEVLGTWTKFFNSTGSDQFVSFNWYDCDIGLTSGKFISMTLGGNINFEGGTIEAQAGSNTLLFELLGQNHSQGTCRFLCKGTRIELRDAGTKLMYCEWPQGNVDWINVDSSSQSSNGFASSHITETYNPGVTAGAIVRHEGCSIQGQHEFQYSSSGSSVWRVNYKGCEFRNGATPMAAMVFTPLGGTTQVGGTPRIRFEDCRGSAAYTVREYGNSDGNWQQNMRAEILRRAVSIKGAFGTNPFSGGAETVILPLNCLITACRLFYPGGGGSGATTATLTLATTEGSPTVLLAVPATPNTLTNGFDYSNEPMFLCDSDAKRTLTLTSNAALNDARAGSILTVEYIG